jgi:VWFA-related protein
MKLTHHPQLGSNLILGVCAWAALICSGVGQAVAQQVAAPPSFTVSSGTPAGDESVTVIHTTTRRVVVDVVVTGPDGKPVRNLAQQDFQVTENRKPQSIRAFEVHSPAEDQSPLPSPPELPSHVFLNLEQTPASGPLVVVLIDYLNTPVTDQAYAHEQIVRFLQQKPASMDVAIFALGDQLSLVQGFTTDTGRLLGAMRSKAAGQHMPATSEDLARSQDTLDAFEDLGRFLATQTGRKNLLWFSESFDMLVLPSAREAERGSLIEDYETGSPNPGSGATVTAANMTPSATTMGLNENSASGFAHGVGSMLVLSEEMHKVAMALAVSQTAVYPIDVRGLTVDPAFTAEAADPSSLSTNPQGLVGTPGMPTQPGSAPASVQSHNEFMQSLEGTQATMAQIAEATGGHAFMNSNGLTAAATQAVTEGSSYYTLVYAPSNLDFDGGLRSIHVTLNRPGCKLAYRSAYYAVDPATMAPEDAQAGALAALMVRGAPEAHQLLFKAQIDPDGVPMKAAPDSPMAAKAFYHSARKPRKLQSLSGMVQPYEIRLAVLTPQMELTATPDGRHHAALEIAVYAYAADGQKLGGFKQNLEAAMPPAVYQQALENGMFHNLKVELPVEASSMRLAILDPISHHAGSLEIALPLPPVEAAQEVKP